MMKKEITKDKEQVQNGKQTISLSRLDKYIDPLKPQNIYDQIIHKIVNKNGNLKNNKNIPEHKEQTDSKKYLFDDQMFNIHKNNTKIVDSIFINSIQQKKNVSLVNYGKNNGLKFRRNNDMF